MLTIDFEVAVPGADEPVSARVGARGGAVEVLSYPRDVSLPLSYSFLPLGYEDAFSDAFCDSVRQQATGDDAERLLRHQGAVTTLMPLSPLVDPALNTNLIHAAADATGGLSAAVTNPLVLTSSEVSLTLGPDAISRTLGDDAALLAPFSAALEMQASTAYLVGSYQVRLAARDLWCDLAQGNAQVQIDLTGTFGMDREFAGRTVVGGVQGP